MMPSLHLRGRTRTRRRRLKARSVAVYNAGGVRGFNRAAVPAGALADVRVADVRVADVRVADVRVADVRVADDATVLAAGDGGFKIRRAALLRPAPRLDMGCAG